MLTYDFDYPLSLSYASGNNVCLSIDNLSLVVPPHRHNFHEIAFVTNGKGVHNINGVSYPVERGDIILFSKNDSHSCHSVKDFHMINCCFTSIENLNYFPIGENTLLVSLSPAMTEEVEAILKVIEIELTLKKARYEYAVQNCIDSILLIISRQNENKISSDPLWTDLLSYISDNYSTVTLQEATDIMRMSKSYFCRKFKQQFSVSFLTYVNQIRIQQAQKLLTSTNLTIPEISEQVGYGTNLCRLHEDFKKFTNTTPHKYKTHSNPSETSAKHTTYNTQKTR